MTEAEKEAKRETERKKLAAMTPEKKQRWLARRRKAKKARHKRDPEVARRQQLRTWYGLTKEQVAEYEALTHCPICGNQFEPDGKQVKRKSVDHDHADGMVRGGICGE